MEHYQEKASFISIFGFTGALHGGLVQSRVANFNFRESNEAVLFYSNKAASRELLYATTIGFAKGVAPLGHSLWNILHFICVSHILHFKSDPTQKINQKN